MTQSDLQLPQNDPEARHPLPICPRCGYDQSGIVQTWTRSCPLMGRCSECGLQFAWALVLNASIRGPSWSFEHDHRRGLLRSVLNWILTSLLTLWPWGGWGRWGAWGFHRRLVMAHRIHPYRLALFLMIWLLLWLPLMHLAVVGLLAYDLTSFPYAPWNWMQVFEISLWPYRYGVLHGWLAFFMFSFVASFLPAAFLVLLLNILGTTLSRARVRRLHLVRGLCYFAPSAALMLPVLALIFVVGSRSLDPNVIVMPWALMAAWVLWIGLWWHQFIASYLQLPRALLIITILIIPTILATMVILVMFWIPVPLY